MESLELVAKLINDMYKFVGAYKGLKELHEKLNEILVKKDAQIEKMSKDNTFLINAVEKLSADSKNKEKNEDCEKLTTGDEKEIERLKQDNQHLDQQLNQQKQRTEQLEKQLRSSHTQISSLEATIKPMQEELKSKMGELVQGKKERDQLENALMETGSLVEKVNEVSLHTDLYLKQIEKNEKGKLMLVNKIKELEEELQKKNEAMSYLTEKLPELTLAIENFQHQLFALKKENEELTERLQNKNNVSVGSNKEIEAKLEETQIQLNQARIENAETKEKIEQFRMEAETKEKEAMALRVKVIEYERQINDKKNNNDEFAIKCTGDECQLKGVRNMARSLKSAKAKETILGNQVEKLKLLVMSLEEVNKQLIEHYKKCGDDSKFDCVGQLSSELISKQNELETVKCEMGKLVSEVNKIKVELGAKSAECEVSKSEVLRLNEELRQTHNGLNIQGNQEIVVKLQNDLLLAGQNLKCAEEALLHKNREVEELQNQLQAMRENQMSNSDAVSDDLLKNYKLVCEVNQKQELNLEIAENLNVDLNSKLYDMERKFRKVAERLLTLEKNEKDYTLEIQAQIKQIYQLAKELQDAQLAIEAAENERNELTQRVLSTQNAANKAEANLREMERAFQDQISEERNKANRLMNLLKQSENERENLKQKVTQSI